MVLLISMSLKVSRVPGGVPLFRPRMERRAVHEHTQQAWPGFASM